METRTLKSNIEIYLAMQTALQGLSGQPGKDKEHYTTLGEEANKLEPAFPKTGFEGKEREGAMKLAIPFLADLEQIIYREADPVIPEVVSDIKEERSLLSLILSTKPYGAGDIFEERRAIDKVKEDLITDKGEIKVKEYIGKYKGEEIKKFLSGNPQLAGELAQEHIKGYETEFIKRFADKDGKKIDFGKIKNYLLENYVAAPMPNEKRGLAVNYAAMAYAPKPKKDNKKAEKSKPENEAEELPVAA